jgi:hypothetical protein
MLHHEFSPSRLEQLRICPGSHVMQQGLPDVETEWSKEGTLLHNAVATGNTAGLNDEQKEVVERCLNFWDALVQEGDEVYVEQKFSVLDTDKEELTYGFIDLCVFNRETGELLVVDWKFGYIPVKDVDQNIQLATYAVAAMQRFGVSKCKCFVFQPRINKHTTYTFANPDAILHNIRIIISRAKDSKIVLNAQQDACRYCKARLTCPAFRVEFQKLTASRGDYDLTDTNTLEKLYDTTKDVKTFISEIERLVKQTIEEKGSCGKYVFQTSEGAREIKDLNALYAVVKDYLTTAEFNSVCKLTMGKFEDLLAGKLIKEVEIQGGKLTKAQAKTVVYEKIRDLITRGNPTKKIVEVA